MSIFAGTTGASTTSRSTDVRRFETELLECVRTRHGDICSTASATRARCPTGDELADAMADFKETFAAARRRTRPHAGDRRRRCGRRLAETLRTE